MKRALKPFFRHCRRIINVSALLRYSILALLLFSIPSLAADSFSKYRIDVGLKLFRTMLKADLSLQEKVSENGFVYINLLYEQDNTLANALVESLRQDIKTLKNIPVKINAISITQYLNTKNRRSLGTFISAKLPEAQLKLVINKSAQYQQILFSPFEGDVEAGVLSGISVESKVRPYINLTALKKNKVKIKSFYIKVAKKYEE